MCKEYEKILNSTLKSMNFMVEIAFAFDSYFSLFEKEGMWSTCKVLYLLKMFRLKLAIEKVGEFVKVAEKFFRFRNSYFDLAVNFLVAEQICKTKHQ